MRNVTIYQAGFSTGVAFMSLVSFLVRIFLPSPLPMPPENKCLDIPGWIDCVSNNRGKAPPPGVVQCGE